MNRLVLVLVAVWLLTVVVAAGLYVDNMELRINDGHREHRCNQRVVQAVSVADTFAKVSRKSMALTQACVEYRICLEKNL